MLGMNKLQPRYFRNAMTTWVVITFIYFIFWWVLPFTFTQLLIAFCVGAFVYGLWFFGR